MSGEGPAAAQRSGRGQCHGDYAAGPLAGLGTLNRRKIAALVGVAAFNHDSGKLRGRRAIWGRPRPGPRGALHVCPGGGARHPVLRVFYTRLLAAGKKPKVALTACMRKLLITLNAILLQQLRWHPEFAGDAL